MKFMGIISFFESISFKKLLGLTVILILSLAIPLTTWVVQQETKTTGKAHFEKPTPSVKKYGQPSSGEPKISLVWPFLGKAGDAVLIYGENLGDNPRDKNLNLGNISITEGEIASWTPTQIEFQIPANISSIVFNGLSLSVAGKTSYWRYPFTVYDLNTKIQAVKEGQILTIMNPPLGGKTEIYFSDGSILGSSQLTGFQIPPGKTINSLVVKDASGSPVSFFVEPSEFGF